MWSPVVLMAGKVKRFVFLAYASALVWATFVVNPPIVLPATEPIWSRRGYTRGSHT